MRKLPIYFLVDVSGSMKGEPIESVRVGLQTIVACLLQEPWALETVHLCLITFDEEAKVVTPLASVEAFKVPEVLPVGSSRANWGAAIKVLCQRVDAEVVKSTADIKGDWKPMVFLMTDGEPTDTFDHGLVEFQKRKWGMVIACAAGPSANTENLKKLTEVVIRLDGASPAVFKAFFPRVSDSVSLGSKSIGSTGKEVTGLDQLSPPPPEIKVVP